MFQGETEEDFIATLTKNNFHLETSVNEVLCSEAGESILIIMYLDSGYRKLGKKLLDMDIVCDEILNTSHHIMH